MNRRVNGVYSATFDQELADTHGHCAVGLSGDERTDFDTVTPWLSSRLLELAASLSTMNTFSGSIVFVLIIALGILSEAYPHGNLHAHTWHMLIKISHTFFICLSYRVM